MTAGLATIGGLTAMNLGDGTLAVALLAASFGIVSFTIVAGALWLMGRRSSPS